MSALKRKEFVPLKGDLYLRRLLFAREANSKLPHLFYYVKYQKIRKCVPIHVNEPLHIYHGICDLPVLVVSSFHRLLVKKADLSLLFAHIQVLFRLLSHLRVLITFRKILILSLFILQHNLYIRYDCRIQEMLLHTFCTVMPVEKPK